MAEFVRDVRFCSVRFLSGLCVLMMATSAWAGGNFPEGPDAKLTPGSVCTHPDTYRYPEHIAYCSRNVTKFEKDAVIQKYDHDLGFNVERMDRQEFKIDHFIPLCAGGSNEADNLWPQHESVYNVTDPLEPLLCDKMSQGKLKQVDAVAFVKRAKLNLSEVPEVMREVQGL